VPETVVHSNLAISVRPKQGFCKFQRRGGGPRFTQLRPKQNPLSSLPPPFPGCTARTFFRTAPRSSPVGSAQTPLAGSLQNQHATALSGEVLSVCQFPPCQGNNSSGLAPPHAQNTTTLILQPRPFAAEGAASQAARPTKRQLLPRRRADFLKMGIALCAPIFHRRRNSFICQHTHQTHRASSRRTSFFVKLLRPPPAYTLHPPPFPVAPCRIPAPGNHPNHVPDFNACRAARLHNPRPSISYPARQKPPSCVPCLSSHPFAPVCCPLVPISANRRGLSSKNRYCSHHSPLAALLITTEPAKALAPGRIARVGKSRARR